MMGLFKILLGLFISKPVIDLPTRYNVTYNEFYYINLNDSIIDDIKLQAYKIIENDSKLLKRLNFYHIITISFNLYYFTDDDDNIDSIYESVRCATHSFYWDGDTLYSMSKESKAIDRSRLLGQLLK